MNRAQVQAYEEIDQEYKACGQALVMSLIPTIIAWVGFRRAKHQRRLVLLAIQAERAAYAAAQDAGPADPEGPYDGEAA
jgi:hypothetical protein